jgi:hypothetical protein
LRRSFLEAEARIALPVARELQHLDGMLAMRRRDHEPVIELGQ